LSEAFPVGAAGVRAAAWEDVDGLAELYRAAVAELGQLRGGRVLLGLQARPEPVEVSFLNQIGVAEAQALVAGFLGTELVGYGSCRVRALADGAALGSIEELFVAAGARRRGAGKAIAGALLHWCQDRGCVGVDASALPGSRAVKSFFESEGFTARLLVMHRPLD